MSAKEELDLVQFVKEKPTYCVACGDQLRRFSLLVCADCLGDDCTAFSKLAEAIEDKDFHS